jgi:hypothetical protein
MRLSVTIDGVWIRSRIYWTIYYTRFISTSWCLAAAFNGGFSPYSEFQKCPRPQLPGSPSNSSQKLNGKCTLTDCSSYNFSIIDSSLILRITSRHEQHRNALPSLIFMGRCLVTAVSLSRGRFLATGLHATVYCLIFNHLNNIMSFQRTHAKANVCVFFRNLVLLRYGTSTYRLNSNWMAATSYRLIAAGY